MRFLDREPVEGDRVHVEFVSNATVVHGGLVRVEAPQSQDDEDDNYTLLINIDYATVRVIAPEPEVGDVVTADMDLPYRTIIEGAREDLAFLTDCDLHGRRSWNHGGDHETLDWLSRSDTWRIVRIGGASDV